MTTTRPGFLARITGWHRLKRWQRVLITIAALIAGSVALYFYTYPIISFNQKVTLEVDYKGQTYTASNVTRVTARYEPAILPQMRGVVYSVRGEAIHLELPGGRHLFALLCTRGVPVDWEGLALKVFPEHFDTPRWPRDIKTTESARELPSPSRLVLIDFEDIQDWKTVRVLNGAKDGSLSEAAKGIDAVRTKVQITEEPVTSSGLANVLPWWRYAEENPYDFPLGICGANLTLPAKTLTRSISIRDLKRER